MMKHIHVTHEENWKGELMILFALLGFIGILCCTSATDEDADEYLRKKPFDKSKMLVKQDSNKDSSQLKNTVYVTTKKMDTGRSGKTH